MKITMRSIAAVVILAGSLALPQGAAFAADSGGWGESPSSYSVLSTKNSASINLTSASTVSHRGVAEQKVINGTTNKRAHGWTTWVGVYHYTTARMESYSGGTVYNTSGRQWGTNGTEAISPWRAFSPYYDLGSARTYYGTN